MPPANQSAIYRGWVRHRRKIPVKHDFKYAIFMLLLDLDELPALFDPYWFWSARKPNICFFNIRDHLKNHWDNKYNLKENVIALVKKYKNITLSGPIHLLTHLRYWGYGFNPVSFYYCYDSQGKELEAIVAEVNNTPWNEQFIYILPFSENLGCKKSYQFIFPKSFHVSPLMSMNFDYQWHFTSPAEKLWVHMKNFQDQKEHFNATLMLHRQAVTSQNLSAILIKHPFMTAKIILGIYWQALRTRLKGAVFYPHP